MKRIFRHGGNKWNLRCMLCLVPSVAGTAVFFVIPYIRMVYYSMINNQFQKKFVFLENYKKVLANPYFRLALRNSLRLILIGAPFLLLLALFLSLLLSFSMRRYAFLRDFFIFPMLVPTAAVVLVWKNIFAGAQTALPVYALFIWKNLGICMILLTAALTTIDPCILEAARLDGAGVLAVHLKISIPMIVPSIFFTLLLSIVNSFKVFKESFLYYGGQYPPEHSYTLQYYMNNHFLKFHYQALAVSSVCTSVLVLAIVLAGVMVQRRFQA